MLNHLNVQQMQLTWIQMMALKLEKREDTSEGP